MFAEIEAAIVKHLSDALPDVAVLTAADLANVTEDRQPAPAVHLIYQHYRVLETSVDGKGARISQSWLVVIANKNARTVRTGKDSRGEASVLADRVLPLLMGWIPPNGHKPLMLETPPKPAFTAGMTYMPLAFAVEVLLR